MTTRRFGSLVLVGAAALAISLLVLSAPALASHTNPPPGGIEIEKFTVTPTTTQAGGHPNVRLFARFCDPDVANEDDFPPTVTPGCTRQQYDARTKDLIFHLPPGFVGNPQVVTPCPQFLFIASTCPQDSQVGYSFSLGEQGFGGNLAQVPTRLLVVQTLGLEPARLGTDGILGEPSGPFAVTVSLRTSGDYGIDSVVAGLPTVLGNFDAKVEQIDTVLCAAAPCTGTAGSPRDGFPITVTPLPGAKPFFVNPTSCKLAQASLQSNTWQDEDYAPSAPANTDSGQTRIDSTHPYVPPTVQPAFTPTGCDNPATQPKMTAEVTSATDSTDAGRPTGDTIAIDYAQPGHADYSNDPIWPSALKDADVVLHPGMTLSPGGGAGLEGCSNEQFGVDASGHQNDNPVECPAGSQVGTVTVTSPLLPVPLDGKVFFGPTTAPGRPTPASPWKLFILIEGAGMRIKLVGDTTLEANGQIRSTFVNQPEVPFSRFELHLIRPDGRAVLSNPPDCNKHEGSATLVGYSGDTRISKPSIQPTTNCDFGTTFSPSIDEASAEPKLAGAKSVSHLVISRPDNDQVIRSLTLSLPPGATGSLAATPLCPKAQALSGNCGEDTKVGNIRTTVGTGNDLLTTSGSLYIGEPVQDGDAASFVIVVPARAGPIDLGKVVVVSRVRLRPSDTGVDVISADIPTTFEGIPLPVRKIDITVDRDNFFINPTGCDKRNFVASFVSDKGMTSSSTVGLAAEGCDRLPFSPKLRLIAGSRGLTKTGAHPPLKAIVTQSEGEASIANARVVLPDIIRPNVPQFQRPGALCNDAQLAARACPALSMIGKANVITPLLPFKLSGPVYIVLSSGSPLPSLAVFLRGHGLEVVLHAKNGFEGIKILNSFDGLPDVPQSRFELTVNGGPNGILNAFKDLCKTRPLPTFDATFTGHNGKAAKLKPRLENAGCVSASSGGVKILSRGVKVRHGKAKIALRCLQARKCRGKLSLKNGKRAYGSHSFSIRAGKKKTVVVKLKRNARSSVAHHKRMRVRATAKLRGGRAAKKMITLRRR
jgi:hypothetical protein